MNSGEPSGNNPTVGLPHHRRPLRKSRRLLKWSVAGFSCLALLALYAVWKLNG